MYKERIFTESIQNDYIKQLVLTVSHNQVSDYLSISNSE